MSRHLIIGIALLTALAATVALAPRRQSHELHEVFLTLSRRDIEPLLRQISADRSLLVQKDLDGNTPLHIAALDGWPEAVKLLLTHGARADAANAAGHTPLHLTFNAPGHQADIVRQLLAAGADPARRLPDGRNALHVAAATSGVDARMLPLLAESPATLDAADGEGLTPAQLADKCGERRTAAVLRQLAVRPRLASHN